MFGRKGAARVLPKLPSRRELEHDIEEVFTPLHGFKSRPREDPEVLEPLSPAPFRKGAPVVVKTPERRRPLAWCCCFVVAAAVAGAAYGLTSASSSSSSSPATYAVSGELEFEHVGLAAAKNHSQVFAAVFADIVGDVVAVSFRAAERRVLADFVVCAYMALEPTLHRAYYRQRQNNRVPGLVTAGAVRLPCETHSRWQRSAFRVFLDIGRTLDVVETDGVFVLSVDGFARTEAASFAPGAGSYTICDVDHDGTVEIDDGSETCDVTFDAPDVAFSAAPPTLIDAALVDADTPVRGVKLLETLVDDRGLCPLALVGEDAPDAVFALDDGVYYLYDPRVKLNDNSVDAPVAGGDAGTMCGTAPKTFLNERSCVAAAAACSTLGYASALFPLDDDHLRAFYELSGRYVYAVEGLDVALVDSPCDAAISRWKRDNSSDACASAVAGRREARFAAAVARGRRGARDAVVADEATACDAADAPAGSAVLIGGACWVHVHDDEGGVFDFTFWASDEGHPGERRWSDAVADLAAFGKRGDVVDFADLVPESQSYAFAQKVGAASSDDGGGFLEACGSPGEVANDPLLGNRYYAYLSEDNTPHVQALDTRSSSARTAASPTSARKISPDENFAREVMQLFTIGLVELDDDGVPSSTPTYDNDDIVEFARAWTAFEGQDARGNVEPSNKGKNTGSSTIDPMRIREPDDGIGDVSDTSIDRVELDRSSALFALLCDPTDDGACDFKSVVDVEENLACAGMECEIDTVRVVRVAATDGAAGATDLAYYEYVRPACVDLAFGGGAALREVASGGGGESQCADPPPRAPVAQAACCAPGKNWAAPMANYAGDRSTLATAEARCASDGGEICDFSWVKRGLYWNLRFWTSRPCAVVAQVDAQGRVNVVHDVSRDAPDHLAFGAVKTTFRVAWDGGAFPSADDGTCAASGCVGRDGGCACNATATLEAVFHDDAEVPVGAAHVAAVLRIGAPDPASLDGAYERRELADDVAVHCLNNGVIDGDAIFEIRLYGEAVSLKNARATYETEAVLDHLMHHRNTPAFVAHKLIQRLATISNPSPRYVGAVAAAFRSGLYDGAGSGAYGCLDATVRAVLLDREARSPALDDDAAHGGLREPTLKVVHLLRALELRLDHGFTELALRTDDAIGMEPHYSPSVFNFYEFDYAPAGVVGDAKLVSPEAQLLTGPFVIGFLNAFLSMAEVGLSFCYDGFAATDARRDALLAEGFRGGESAPNCNPIRLGSVRPTSAYWSGNLTWTPRASVVDELAVLLTAGRLDAASRGVISDAVAASDDPLKLALLLFAAAPAFHATNRPRSTDAERDAKAATAATAGDDDYKAVVFVFLSGGVDTFNVLAPKDDDLYAHYAEIRGDVAIDADDLLDTGDAAFVANAGVMVEPVTKAEFEAKSSKVPADIFSHNHASRMTQSLDADDLYASGALEGGPAPPDVLDRKEGVVPFDPEHVAPDGTQAHILNLTRQMASLYAETWSSNLEHAILSTISLGDALETSDLATDMGAGDNTYAQAMETAARVIAARRELGRGRDVLYYTSGGFDSHSDVDETLRERLDDINDALDALATELRGQGVWNDTVVVVCSEFGRTLTSNGLGTDHGWGGHALLLGGGVAGGQILGDYPADFSEASELNVGRGRMIPTTPWEGLWAPVATWFGVDDGDLATVLPNIGNFPEDMILDHAAVFR
ncbi:hypothetical protein JL722_6519 [Aureococcus anophagefferens]|nr:hypothetical protein JL722_6519 [Aureococcus anophagefferens]